MKTIKTPSFSNLTSEAPLLNSNGMAILNRIISSKKDQNPKHWGQWAEQDYIDWSDIDPNR